MPSEAPTLEELARQFANTAKTPEEALTGVTFAILALIEEVRSLRRTESLVDRIDATISSGLEAARARSAGESA